MSLSAIGWTNVCEAKRPVGELFGMSSTPAKASGEDGSGISS